MEYKGGYIFIDLDGVLANFDKEAAKYPHLHPSKACREIEGFYTNLEVFQGAIEFVNRLETIFPNKVRFLSAAVIERDNCWTEKFTWIKTHFPSFTDRLILARSKEAVGSVEDILIDDHPQWNGADKFRGQVIKFSTDKIPDEYQRILFLLTGA
jgi:5'(3')-deoxyribonucleotidase